MAGNAEEVNAQTTRGAQTATMQAVSGDYFDALGVPAMLGRTLVSGPRLVARRGGLMNADTVPPA